MHSHDSHDSLGQAATKHHSLSGLALMSPSRRRLALAGALSVLGSGALQACSKPSEGTQEAANTQGAGPSRVPPLRSSLAADGPQRPSATQASGSQLLALYETVQKSMYGFSTGNEASELVFHVVVDVMCPHCGHTWVQSQPLWKDFKFVWMPVPMISEKSMTYGSIIMASANPAQAMNVHKHKLLSKQDLMPVDAQLVNTGRPQLAANLEVAKGFRLDSVPFILHKRLSGEIVSSAGGMNTADLQAIAAA